MRLYSFLTLDSFCLESSLPLAKRINGMEQDMPTRMALFVTAIFTMFLAAVFVTAQASHAADDCLAKPNVAAPQGSHWYYRVDRTTRRECWYLGAEGGKVRLPAHQDASPARSRPSKISAQPVEQTPARATEVAAAEAIPVEITTGQAQTPEENSAAVLSVRRSDLPISTVSIGRRSESMANSYAAEQSTTDPENETPLIWPILSPAEFSAAEQPPDFPISLAQVGAVLGAVLGLAAMIGRLIFKLSAPHRPSRSHSRDRGGLTASTLRRGEQVPPTAAAVTHQAGLARRTGKPPSRPSNPGVDIEPSVRRLLQELQRRQRAEISNGVEGAEPAYLMRRSALRIPTESPRAFRDELMGLDTER